MKIINSILILLFMSLASSPTIAQKKVGVFVHGFNGSGEKWTVASKVPSNFISNETIDEAVVLNYSTEELLTETSQSQMLTRFILEMNAKGHPINDEWILVGHSLGGIVSRVLYPAFKSQGFNIKAVVSIGGPSQGAAATNVDLNYINQEFTRLQQDFNLAAANEHTYVTFVVNLLSVVSVFDGITGFDIDSPRRLLEQIPPMIDSARVRALDYANEVVETRAKDIIGLDGSIIQEINSYPKTNFSLHPENYLSIIGAEKDPTPIRMAGHIFDEQERNDEVQYTNDLNTFEIDYVRKNVREWNKTGDRWNACAWISSSCRASRDLAYEKEGYWSTARTNIQNLSTSWSTMINSFQFVRESYQVYLPPCSDDGGGTQPGPTLDLMPGYSDCNPGPTGIWVTRYTTVQIPDKNDGVVNTHSVLWSGNDEFGDQNNLYFDDLGQDGGYNHFELRHYYRPYTLPGVFNIGDDNPPMGRLSDWIKNDYRPINN